MRDIKFRQFDKRINQFVFFKLVDAEIVITNDKVVSFDDDRADSPIGQFTGFEDSSRADIYEGDIVYIAGFGNGVASLCHANGAEFTNCNGDYRAARYAAAENDIGEIIGNVHQNPDLLEQNQ